MTDGGDLHAGSTLGRYELLLPLATGATASVWAARMTGSRGFEKIVAVKTMLTDDMDSFDTESMFLDEARLVSRIRHPNVCEVLDLGEEEGALYIVMEFIDGEPLQVIAREAHGKGGVPVPVAVRIVKEAAAGLHAAHDLCDPEGKPVGLVHRDVSPQNILVGYDGVVKVIDFGVAKAASNQQRTNVGQIKGKVAYMAPEQMMGEGVDRRTDVFALGVVLYQLITGKHPFRADNEFATMARIRDKRPADPPSALNPAVTPAIDQVILKALAKSRDERYATMAELGRALERAQPSKPDSAGELTSYIAALLADRAGKKAHAIREALRAASERSGGGALSRSSPLHQRPPLPPSSSPALPKPAPSSPEAVPSKPAPPSAPAPAAVAPQAAAVAPAADRLSPMPELRRRPGVGLIVVGVALVLALGLAIWSMTGTSGDEGSTPTKHSW